MAAICGSRVLIEYSLTQLDWTTSSRRRVCDTANYNGLTTETASIVRGRRPGTTARGALRVTGHGHRYGTPNIGDTLEDNCRGQGMCPRQNAE